MLGLVLFDLSDCPRPIIAFAFCDTVIANLKLLPYVLREGIGATECHIATRYKSLQV